MQLYSITVHGDFQGRGPADDAYPTPFEGFYTTRLGRGSTVTSALEDVKAQIRHDLTSRFGKPFDPQIEIDEWWQLSEAPADLRPYQGFTYY
jgi:hypothetical protein